MPRRRLKTRQGLLHDAAADSPSGRVAGKRHLRKAQILRLLRNQGPLARVEIARTLGFNLRSVSLLVDALVGEGLLLEQAGRTTANGRRPIPVALNASAAGVLGIDVGRSSTSVAVMDLQGQSLVQQRFRSDFSSTPARQLEWLCTLLDGFLHSHKAHIPPLAGAGISTEGLSHKSRLYHGWPEAAEEIRIGLESHLGVPVIAGEDSHFLAMGEQWFGEAREVRNAAIFNLTDGLGLGLLMEGSLFEGHRKWAGQVGHLPLGQTGLPCFCGSTGCLENIASGSGLLRIAADHLPQVKSVSQLASLAAEGSKPARECFDQFARSLATGVAIVIDLFNPQVVILSGPLAAHSAAYFPQFETHLEKLAIPFMRKDTRVAVSELGKVAVLLGTCAAVFNRIYDTSQVKVESIL